MCSWELLKVLDSTTKKRIDDARDILVGKIPDPKSQIEQITIALIYKFMDDMDKKSEELGGQAKFFTGDYSKYSWNEILDPSVGGFELVTSYGEAIQKMNQNPNLPQLFRDIFKNAYLPYRDPETLKQFLRIIDDFKYDHSERLGDAFEYLLSVMGSQGDAGQFRTPRHIIEFIVDVVDPSAEDTILDPACGTAGFLISAYKHILEKNTDDNRITLTPDQRKKLVENIVGYDISPDMVRLSLVNLYLHGFKDPHIYEYDTLTSDEKWDETYDVCLANPPFMTPKGGIKPHNRFSVKSNRSEVLFVDYMHEHLNNDGRAGIVVPEGIIFQSGKAYKDLRKTLIDNSLYAVVSLPAGVFNPYSGVKTSILFLDKKIAKKSSDILFVKVEADGFNLGAQRREIKENDLPLALQVLQDYKKSVLKGLNFSADKYRKVIAHVAPKKEITKQDWNLSGGRYKDDLIFSGKWELVELGDISEKITDGSHNPPKSKESGELMLSSKNIYNDGLVLDSVRYISEEEFERENKRTDLQEGDVLLTIVGTIGRVLVYDNSMPRFTLQRSVGVIKPKKIVNSYYLASILKSEVVQKQLNAFAKGVAQKGVYLREIKQIKIPLPPIEIQERIVEDIESYQKILDGAKKVVENYKPNIKIESDWNLVELANVCKLNPKKSEVKELPKDLEVSFVPMSDVNEHQMYFKPQQVKKISEVYSGYTYFKENDVLLARVTPCFENGKSGIARNLKNNIGFGSSEYFVFRPSENILSQWIYFFISKNSFLRLGKPYMTGTGGLQRLTKEFVSTFKIPLPPIETQKEILTQIEEEQKLVNSNKKLIELFEKKIQDKISEVW